jgi:hypothetical protein
MTDTTVPPPVIPTMTEEHAQLAEIFKRSWHHAHELPLNECDYRSCSLLAEIRSLVCSIVSGEIIPVPRKEIEGWLSDLLLIPAISTKTANELEAIYSNMNYWLRLTPSTTKESAK